MGTQGIEDPGDLDTGSKAGFTPDSSGHSGNSDGSGFKGHFIQTFAAVCGIIIFFGIGVSIYVKITSTYESIALKQNQCLIEIEKTNRGMTNKKQETLQEIKETKNETLREIERIHQSVNEKINNQNSKIELIRNDINDIKYTGKTTLNLMNSK